MATKKAKWFVVVNLILPSNKLPQINYMIYKNGDTGEHYVVPTVGAAKRREKMDYYRTPGVRYLECLEAFETKECTGNQASTIGLRCCKEWIKRMIQVNK